MEQTHKTNWLKIVLVTVVVAIAVSTLTAWLISVYLFPKQFRPTQLSAKEEQVLENKLSHLNPRIQKQPSSEGKTPAQLAPQPYRETEASREISLTERELNGLLAKNTDLAKKLAIDLSDNLASANLLLPLDPDLPRFGWKDPAGDGGTGTSVCRSKTGGDSERNQPMGCSHTKRLVGWHQEHRPG